MMASDRPEFTFAFQPIADIERRTVFAYEALIRGVNRESAAEVFARVPADELYGFDHDARLAAVTLAAHLALDTRISLNVLPGSLEVMPDSLDRLLETTMRVGLTPRQLLLEVTEVEAIRRPAETIPLLSRYRAHGVNLAIDDFGAGHSGLNLLADFQPDLVKLDMQLIRNIDRAGPRQAIARGVLQVCDDLGIEVIVEGLETLEEYRWLRRLGVRLFQGYLLGRPSFESLDPPHFPDAAATAVGASSRG